MDGPTLGLVPRFGRREKRCSGLASGFWPENWLPSGHTRMQKRAGWGQGKVLIWSGLGYSRESQ